MLPLTQGPVARRLWALTWPASLGLLSISALHLIDTLFVARLGTGALAAMGLVMPVVLLFGGVGNGVGVAATARVAQALGRGDPDTARDLGRWSLGLAAGVGVLGAALALPLLALGSPQGPAAIEARRYLGVWLAGLPVVLVSMTAGALLRGTGDTRTPARALGLAAALNAGLDPLLIGWAGLPGVAGATLVARLAAATLLVGVLGRRGLLTRPAHPAGGRTRLSELAGIAVPASLSQAILPLTTAAITGLLTPQGEAAVAAFTAASRVEALALLPLMGLGAAMAPFVGQNHGARRGDRVRAGWRASLTAAGLGGPVLWGLLAVSAPWLAAGLGVPEAARPGFVLQLRLLPAGFVFQGVLMSAGPTLNALGRPRAATALTLLRGPGLTLPLALVGGRALGVPGILGGMALANGLAGLAALPWVTARLPDAGPGAPTPAKRYKRRPWTRSSWWERAGWARGSGWPWPVMGTPWSGSGAGGPREPRGRSD